MAVVVELQRDDTVYLVLAKNKSTPANHKLWSRLPRFFKEKNAAL